MKLRTELGKNSYDVVIERGSLSKLGELLDLDRKTLIVTDTGVPSVYTQIAASQAGRAVTVTIPQSEGGKTLESYSTILKAMLDNSFTRKDCVIAVGGGMVGDVAGFAAASYMRGVDFYNVPTTLLSQIDSSVGGKTAVNFGGVKNIVGAFYQPKKVVVDPDVLVTLDKRKIAEGLCEGLKMAAVFDEELFRAFENGEYENDVEKIVVGSLKIKINVVEKDEKEKDLRKLLNFGHTVGHGIESVYKDRYFHGECVALGMLPMCSDKARKRILPVLEKLGLPTEYDFDLDKVFEEVDHDKKGEGDGVTAVFLDDIVKCRLEYITYKDLRRRVDNYLSGEDAK